MSTFFDGVMMNTVTPSRSSVVVVVVTDDDDDDELDELELLLDELLLDELLLDELLDVVVVPRVGREDLPPLQD
jgi:hypothetical protein